MRLAPLVGIEVAAFLLIIAETYVFFDVVAPTGTIPHDPLGLTAYGLLKAALTVGLGLVWFLVMVALTRIYTRSKISPSPRPSS